MIRVTLDSYKLLWSQMDNSLTEVYGDDFKRVHCVNEAEEKFVSKYHEFKKKAQEARELEIRYVGVEPLKALDSYKEVIRLGNELISKIDPNKIENSKNVLRVVSFKRSLIELVISFFGGALATLFVAFFILGVHCQ